MKIKGAWILKKKTNQPTKTGSDWFSAVSVMMPEAISEAPIARSKLKILLFMANEVVRKGTKKERIPEVRFFNVDLVTAKLDCKPVQKGKFAKMRWRNLYLSGKKPLSPSECIYSPLAIQRGYFV